MESRFRLAGVDGCREGWVVALAQSWPLAEPVALEFRETFAEVLELTAAIPSVAVDMPIGLPDGSAVRACDVEARLALGPQRSSIFLAPPRETLDSRTPQEFQALHRRLRSVGAGLPVWGIVPKMREVNEAMERDPALEQRVFEFHPELTWRRLAEGGQAIPSKKSAQGVLARIGLLNRGCGAGWIPRRIPSEPALDDVLDAISGLASAAAEPSQYRFPSSRGKRNRHGLRMEIRY